MSVLVAILIVFACFFVPLILIGEEPGFFSGMCLAMAAFLTLGLVTSESSTAPVDRSNVEVVRMTADGQSMIHVIHSKDTYKSTDAFIYENFEDTTKVEVKIESEDDVWSVESHNLIVQPK